MNICDDLSTLSTSTLTITACEIAEGRLEVYTKTTTEDLSLAYREVLAGDRDIASILEPLGWVCVQAGAMDPGFWQVWTR